MCHEVQFVFAYFDAGYWFHGVLVLLLPGVVFEGYGVEQAAVFHEDVVA